jgi:hypothetical protein
MRLLFTCLLALLSISVVRAADEGHALSARVASAHAAGETFESFTLMVPAQAAAHKEVLTHETLFRPDATAVSRLYQTHPSFISLKFRNDAGKEYELQLFQSHPLSSNAHFGKIDATGRHDVTTFDPGVHYQGSVAGSEQSMAAVSVFADGRVMVLFSNEDGNFILGELEDGSGNYIFYNDNDMIHRPMMPCATRDDGGDDFVPAPNAKTTKATLCNKVQVYWEVANNVFVAKGSYALTQTYITGLFNQFQAMYANEKIAMELKTLFIWTTADDIPTASSGDGLDWIKGSWNATGDAFDGDLAHIIVKDGKGNGGVAYVDVLCNRNNGYGYSDIQGAYSTVPTYSWDVEVITHETGHNLGSKHTHWCGWMTGAGGTCGSIDDCTTQETTASCSSCGATTTVKPTPPVGFKGTVMSYCHLLAAVGINLANGFGTLPGNKIRTEVSGATCLNHSINAVLKDTAICGSGVGSITLSFATDNFGTAPYTYSWSNSAKTQSLKSLTNPGNYSVTITDSNGCTAGFNTDLIRRPSPGTSIVPSAKMPICCINTGVPLILTTTAPQSLTSCQSVYWLRSAAQPTTYAMAKAIYDTTNAANIFASTNQSSIDAGAQLNVMAPSSCTSKSTFYYTPIAVNLPRAAHSITVGATGPTNITSKSVNIGKYVSLPDETGTPTACDQLDTPSTQTISVTVSGYSGRAGKMRLALTDLSTGRVVYEAFGLSGNGSYVIHNYDIDGNILSAIKVSAFDYNCTSSACTASTVTVAATRNVVYPAHAASAAAGCTIGSALKVEFAPSGCTKLDAGSLLYGSLGASLHPNPANSEAMLDYQLSGQQLVQVRVVDLLGQTVWQASKTETSGTHRIAIPVNQWAKGVYTVQLQAGAAGTESLRLVVE